MCDCSMCMRARELVSFARVREEMPWLWKVCVCARGGWMVTADRANIGHFISPHGADMKRFTRWNQFCERCRRGTCCFHSKRIVYY